MFLVPEIGEPRFEITEAHLLVCNVSSRLECVFGNVVAQCPVGFELVFVEELIGR